MKEEVSNQSVHVCLVIVSALISSSVRDWSFVSWFIEGKLRDNICSYDVLIIFSNVFFFLFCVMTQNPTGKRKTGKRKKEK
jgi:hypothetical protein